MSVAPAPPPTPRGGTDARGGAGKTQKVGYADFIDQRIEKTRTSVVAADLATGVVTLLAGTLGYLLIAAAVEHWLVPGGFGSVGRAVAFLAGVAGACVYAATRIAPLVWRRINPVYAARELERGSDGLKNSLVSVLQLRGRGGSSAVATTLERQAAEGLARTGEAPIDRTPLVRALQALLVCVGVVGAYVIISPKDFFASAGRVVAPWAEIAAPTRVRIDGLTPGDLQVRQGDRPEVSALVSGLGDEDRVWLVYSTADGRVANQHAAMDADGEANATATRRFRVTLPPGDALANLGLQSDLTYRVVAGDARTSLHRIEVLATPAIAPVSVAYEPPAYTGYPDRESESADLRGIEGTRVTIAARANLPIESAQIDLGVDGSPDVRMRVDGDRATAAFTLRRPDGEAGDWSSHYVLRFTSADGRANHDPPRYRLEVLADLPPEATWLEPAAREDGEPIAVRLDDSVDLIAEARDPDFALSRLRFVGDSDGETPLDVDRLDDGDGRGRVVARTSWTPRELGLSPGDRLSCWIEATDNRSPEANVARSARREFVIVGGRADGDRGSEGGRGAQPGDSTAGEPGGGQADPSQQDRPQRGAPQRSDPQQSEGGDSRQDGPQPPRGDRSEQGNEPGPDGQPSGNEQRGDNASDSGGQNTGNQEGEPAGEQNQEQNGGANGQENAADPNGLSRGSEQSGGQRDENGEGGNSGGQRGEGPPQPGESPSGANDSAADNASDGNAGGSEAGGDDRPGRDRRGSNQPDGGERGEGQPSGSRPADGDNRAERRVQRDGSDDGEAFDRVKRFFENQERDSAQRGDNRRSENNRDADERSGKPSDGSSDQRGEPGAADRVTPITEGEPPAGREPSEVRRDPNGGQRDGQQPSEIRDAGEAEERDSVEDGGNQPGESSDDSFSQEATPADRPSASQDRDGARESADDGSRRDSGGRSDSLNDQRGPDADPGRSTDPNAGPREGVGSPGDNQAADRGTGQSGDSGLGTPNDRPGDGRRDPRGDGNGNRSGERGPGERSRPTDRDSGQRRGPGDAGDRSEQSADGRPSEFGNPAGSNQPGGERGSEGDPTRDRRGEDASGAESGDATGDPSNRERNGDQRPGDANQQDRTTRSGDQRQTDRTDDPRIDDEDAAIGDDANLDYTRRQTELVLNRLEDELADREVAPELLDELGWSESDLRRFLDRWRGRQRQAKRDGDAGEARLDRALRSLGLGGRGARRTERVGDDSLRDLNERARPPAPPAVRDALRRFQRSLSRDPADGGDSR